MTDGMLDSVHPAGSEESHPLLPAILSGLGAAVVGGIAWTVIMAVTGYEIGFAAWALGAFVGFAMRRTTPRRDTAAALSAATLALAGLLLARILIGEFVMARLAVDEVLADDELMVQAAALDLQFSNGFPPVTQARYDALAATDTIPDALWEDMVAAASGHLEGLSEEERVRIAEQFTGLMLSQAGMAGRVTGQLSMYDLLWAFLALSTAWSMLKRGSGAQPVEADWEDAEDSAELPDQ